MDDLLPPFHKVMSEALECHLANDRIAVLEAEYDKLADELAVSKRLNGEWMDKRTEAVIRAEQAEAELAQRDRILDEAARTIFTMECAYKGIFDEDEAVPVILADIRASVDF